MSSTRKIFLLVGLPLLAVFIILALYLVEKAESQKTASNQGGNTAPAGIDPSAENDRRINEGGDQKSTVKIGSIIKSIGFNLDYYDPVTKTAGEIKFTKLTQPGSEIWVDFGIQDIRSPNDPTKKNVQPTFILPLGTKVQSLVDGEVTNVEKLYSNDYTIMVMAKGTDVIFETEHVINPLVKKGDQVKAGQIIAEVSTHDSQYHPGFGILEIGILQGGNPPQHLCPFAYLHKSIKDETYKKIQSLYKGWEEYRGDATIYDETNYPVPGCATLEPAVG